MSFEPVHLDFERYKSKTWTLEAYKARGGYVALLDVLKEKKWTPEKIIDEVKASGLRGRGGAGFPTGTKWSFINKKTTKQIYLCCNADEGEPGTFKDKAIMDENPHQIVEGMIIAAYAINCHHCYIYIRGEFVLEIERVQKAVDEAYAQGYLGKNILGSGFDLEMVVHVGAGAYICGDETALLSSIEGHKGQPKNKPPFPAVEGLFKCPTIVNNVASLAAVPYILRKGAKAYASMGTEKSTGTFVFSISGHVNKPGTYEVPMGFPFMEFLEKFAGGVTGGKKLKALIPGGSSTPVLTAEECIDLKLDYENCAAKKTMLGSGAIIVLAEGTCMVKVSQVLTRFYHHESCGQCTPCREGTGWMDKIIDRIEEGKGMMDDIDTLYRVQGQIMGNTICPLGDAAAMPIESIVRKFKDEFETHVRKGACPFKNKFPLLNNIRG